MVGGTVIGLARGKENTLVHVQDTTYGNDQCSIRVVEQRRDNGSPVKIKVGDSIWWQSRDAMWTPKSYRDAGGVCRGTRADGCAVTWDIHLPRIGYSH